MFHFVSLNVNNKKMLTKNKTLSVLKAVCLIDFSSDPEAQHLLQ